MPVDAFARVHRYTYTVNSKQIRAAIGSGHCRGRAFRELVFGESGFKPDNPGETGYDKLDVLVNRLLSVGEMPAPTIGLTAEMVEFYKTPVKVVLEMIDRVEWKDGDVFVDLGSGLGQVVLLVHLLTGVIARGVEIEPAYCEYARACASTLGMTDVDFVPADARVADLSAGTVFFLFTPFKGEVLFQVMERLRVAAAGREIRVVSYGPCSAELARLDWLTLERDGGGAGVGEGDGAGGTYALQIFNTRSHL